MVKKIVLWLLFPTVMLGILVGKKCKNKIVGVLAGISTWFVASIVALALIGAFMPVDEEARLKAQHEKQIKMEAKAQADKVKAEEEAKAKAEEERISKLTEEQKQAEAKAKAEAEKIAAEKKAEEEAKAQELAKIEAEKKAKEEAKAQAQADFDSWVKSKFSAWDGSCIPLVDLVKKNMNDPSSFEHIETRYKVNNLNNVVVIMKFRGTNAFGGKIIDYTGAIMDYKTNYITIKSDEEILKAME